MEQPNGSRALYEIQALITAQEMKSAHRIFVDLNHETLERQQKELNWERLRLKIPTGKKQLKALEVNNAFMNQQDSGFSPMNQYTS